MKLPIAIDLPPKPCFIRQLGYGVSTAYIVKNRLGNHRALLDTPLGNVFLGELLRDNVFDNIACILTCIRFRYRPLVGQVMIVHNINRVIQDKSVSLLLNVVYKSFINIVVVVVIYRHRHTFGKCKLAMYVYNDKGRNGSFSDCVLDISLVFYYQIFGTAYYYPH